MTSIYEAIGTFVVIYLTATSAAGHMYILHHGWRRIKSRSEKGRLHEYEAEKTLMDMRHPEVR